MKRRNTKHRQAIVKLFQKSHVLTAKTIMDAYPTMDTSTIYRNLQRLTEDGTIKELRFQKDITSYELSEHEHQHFVCNTCDTAIAFDIEDEYLAKLLPKNFAVDTADVQIRGECGDCVAIS